MRHRPYDGRRTFPPRQSSEEEDFRRRRRSAYGRDYAYRRASNQPRRPWDLPPGGGYSGPGEAGRYGNAPVPYGPDHTYDYHLGDRYGYGPDFQIGEPQIGHHPPPRRPPWRRRRR